MKSSDSRAGGCLSLFLHSALSPSCLTQQHIARSLSASCRAKLRNCLCSKGTGSSLVLTASVRANPPHWQAQSQFCLFFFSVCHGKAWVEGIHQGRGCEDCATAAYKANATWHEKGLQWRYKSKDDLNSFTSAYTNSAPGKMEGYTLWALLERINHCLWKTFAHNNINFGQGKCTREPCRRIYWYKQSASTALCKAEVCTHLTDMFK